MPADVDAATLPQPLVKWSAEPAAATDVPRTIDQAIHTALLPARGPVYVSVPYDDWAAEADPESDHLVHRTVTTGGALSAAVREVSEAFEGHDLVLVPGAPVFRYHQDVPGRYLPAGTRLVQGGVTGCRAIGSWTTPLRGASLGRWRHLRPFRPQRAAREASEPPARVVLPAVLPCAAARTTPVPGYAAETTEVAFTQGSGDDSAPTICRVKCRTPHDAERPPLSPASYPHLRW